jgi:hypothetical protein
MASILSSSGNIERSKIEKNLTRFFSIYFILQVLPIDFRFIKHFYAINWLNVDYRDIFYLTRFSPTFTGDDSFLNWLFLGILALIGTFFLNRNTSKPINYDALYYWARVAVRYRLAIAVIGYGFLKFYPIQAPIPSISNLNTNYGDFTAWKLFSLGLGVVPGYQSFLGLIEIAAGLLLFNRKTATIAALIILPFTGNVAISNIAYEGGEYIYAFYLISLALFLFAFDAFRLFNLLSLDKATKPNRYKPVHEGYFKQYRIVVKTLFIAFFVIFYGYKTKLGYEKGGYQFPTEKGIENISGLYNVSEFKWNGTEIPYSKTDSVRWQNVVFEKWNTISIKSNQKINPVHLPTEELFVADSARIYELAGAQGRHYYSYDFNPQLGWLTLKNRNSNHGDDKLYLSYKPLNDSTIVLSGITSKKDSVHAVLNKINKKYLTFEAQQTGRRNGIKL